MSPYAYHHVRSLAEDSRYLRGRYSMHTCSYVGQTCMYVAAIPLNFQLPNPEMPEHRRPYDGSTSEPKLAQDCIHWPCTSILCKCPFFLECLIYRTPQQVISNFHISIVDEITHIDYQSPIARRSHTRVAASFEVAPDVHVGASIHPIEPKR